MKAALAQFIFESNTFVPEKAEIDIFKSGGVWIDDEASLREWAATVDTQMQGSLQVLDAAGWLTHPVFCAICGSSAGRLSAACFKEIRDTMLDCLRRVLPCDVIILHLHGAACAEGADDTEGNLIKAVREELGFTGRLVLSLDLHANLTRRMIRHVDAVTAYRTYPHTDFTDTGERAARLALHPTKLKARAAKMGALVPISEMRSRESCFAEMLALARQYESSHGLAEVSLLPVQPWMDIDELGSAVVVTAEAGKDIDAPALELAQAWYDQRHRWKEKLYAWDEIRSILMNGADQPLILADVADATSGGSAGHSADALKQLLPLKDDLPGEVLLWVVDKTTVEAVKRGETRFRTGNPPVEWEADAVYAGEHSYAARGKSMTGTRFSMGEAAILRNGRITLVACTRPALVSDPAFFECLDLDPNNALAVQAKSHKGWIASYECDESRGLAFDGPGYTSLNYKKIPFRTDMSGVYPINPNPLNPIMLWQ